MLKKLLNRINSIDKFISTEKGRNKEIKRQLKLKRNKLKILKIDNTELEKCILLLDYIVQNTEGKIVELFQSTVSAALKDIFDDSYEFRFYFKRHGNLSSCEYQTKSAKHPVWSNISMTRGDSIIQIIAAVLRIILVKIDKNSLDIVVLDEPLGGLNPRNTKIAGKFLNDLCKTYGIQLIIVTQSLEMLEYADEVLEIR